MARVTIRYWAAARQAAGVSEESLEAVTLSDVLNAAVARRKPGDALEGILQRSSFLVNATAVRRQSASSIMLDDHAVVEVLSPFAGG